MAAGLITDRELELAEAFLGPRWPPKHVFFTTLILYTLILLVGLLANLFVIVTSVLHATKLSISDWYLLSLALSDLVLLMLGVPFELRDASTAWYPYPYPESICRGRAFLTEMTGSISALTIAAFTIQRYFAVCYPLKVQLVSNPIRRTLRIIGIVWIIGFAIAFPCLLVVTINIVHVPPLSIGIPEPTDADWNSSSTSTENISISSSESSDGTGVDGLSPLPGSEYCYFDETRPYTSMVYVHFSFWISFMLPLLLIIVLYVRIVLSIRSAFALHATNTRGHRELSKRRSAINMSIAVATSFFICWLPFHLQRLLAVHVNTDNAESQNEQVQNFQSVLFFVSGYFYYANSVANPILCTLLTERMRHALLEFLWCKNKIEVATTSPSAISLSIFSRQHSRTSLSVSLNKGCADGKGPYRKASPMTPTRPMLVRYSPQNVANYGTEAYLVNRVSSGLALMMVTGERTSDESAKQPMIIVSSSPDMSLCRSLK